MFYLQLFIVAGILSVFQLLVPSFWSFYQDLDTQEGVLEKRPFNTPHYQAESLGENVLQLAFS